MWCHVMSAITVYIRSCESATVVHIFVRIMWCDVRIMWWCEDHVRIMWCHVRIMWCDVRIMWCDVRIMWCHVRTMWCDVMWGSCDVMWGSCDVVRIMWCHVRIMWCHVRIMWWSCDGHVMSCDVMCSNLCFRTWYLANLKAHFVSCVRKLGWMEEEGNTALGGGWGPVDSRSNMKQYSEKLALTPLAGLLHHTHQRTVSIMISDWNRNTSHQKIVSTLPQVSERECWLPCSRDRSNTAPSCLPCWWLAWIHVTVESKRRGRWIHTAVRGDGRKGLKALTASSLDCLQFTNTVTTPVFGCF